MAEQTAVRARRDGASARGYAVPEVTVRLAGALLARLSRPCMSPIRAG